MSVRKAAMILYRCCWIVFVALVLASFLSEPLIPYGLTFVPAGAAIAIGLLMGRRSRTERARTVPPVEVEPPVAGRWSALNSPADKVPSHGTHGYGQTYAIDIVAEPEFEPKPLSEEGGEEGGEKAAVRPPFRWLWPVVRRNRDFPAFGAPLLAVADGTVVHASHGQRDHLSRNSGPALAYLMLIEASVRDMTSARRIVGNHLVLDIGDGTYAMYAHLRRGSLRVRAGDTVRAGQELAECGNSGNSTEPHVHFQLMDDPDLDVARGIPFSWRGIGIPANGEHFTAAAPETGPSDADPDATGTGTGTGTGTATASAATRSPDLARDLREMS
ncbi:peptidoglycan DD-metalloendopeptidase family protein [Streptomyces finlayi]|uniref:Peptidoglycan DD-metalloendopeptidase family protein n=1 Tax=Streptomyces finlayi TaxID=67296 RepID=A0A7G7BKY1_9ACTN|nr:M23 family metallopeptidase [Streptomyces finlayi]QNE75996.1 peptidoglycan DD-metalloendopeptidase family protein [Streptomyces finlayi]